MCVCVSVCLQDFNSFTVTNIDNISSLRFQLYLSGENYISNPPRDFRPNIVNK